MAAVQVKYCPVGALAVLILLSTLTVISLKSRKRTKALTKDLQPTRGATKTVPDCLGHCACLKFTDSGCTEKINLVFIRTERTGSDVLASMFHRFGHERKLEFVLPRGGEDDLYLGWPGPVDLKNYRPRHTRHFNLLVERTVYNKQALRHVLPHGASYVTVLREPWAQFKSAFHYYGVGTVVGIQGDDPIAEFLQRPQYYDDVYTSSAGVSVTRSPMARDLGISEQAWYNETAINEQIKTLETDFTIVMMTERLHESLVLLKRLMCWRLQDILYWPCQDPDYSLRLDNNPDSRAKHRKWSSADYMLYEHFNKTLQRKISKQGKDFIDEVNHFTTVLQSVLEYCQSNQKTYLVVAASPWNLEFVLSQDYCRRMKMNTQQYLNVFKTSYQNLWPGTQ
ncbi:galactosylceramide sulfotransferase-like isoform X2 [Branchiostoma floridae x Branchiostoma japonicum]